MSIDVTAPAEDLRRDSELLGVRSYHVWQTSGLENTQAIGIFICQTLSVFFFYYFFLRHLSPCLSHPVSVGIQNKPRPLPHPQNE